MTSGELLLLTCWCCLLFKVYSLLRGVLRLDLYDTTTEEDVHINQLLIRAGFAQFVEESSASKVRNITKGKVG